MSRSILIPAEAECLEPFVDAGVLGPTEVHAVTTFVRSVGEQPDAVLLAAALAVRAPLHGHVCIDLSTVRDTVVAAAESFVDTVTSSDDSVSVEAPDADSSPASTGSDEASSLDSLPWPEPGDWATVVVDSPLVRSVGGDEDGGTDRSVLGVAPLVFDNERLYLTRLWALERYLAADLVHRAGTIAENSASDPTLATAAASEVERLFTSGPTPADADQLAAAVAGVHRNFVVISGGPGTGKTTTVARFLAGLVSAAEQAGEDLRIALVAPTGKAAARMTEAVRQAVLSLEGMLDPSVATELGRLEASTIHRLLGRADGVGFRHGPDNPVPHDVVIVDEVSMVSLSLMAHLLAAVRESAKVVLVGDPHQLASVEAGAVLGDIVSVNGETPGLTPTEGRPADVGVSGAVRVLGTVHRQAEGSSVLALANAIQAGDVDTTLELLSGELEGLRWIDPAAPTARAALERVEARVADVAAETVLAAGEGRIDDALGLITDIKVLCALRRGTDGVDGWNQRVEKRLRARRLIGSEDWYEGRPVMVTENDYLNRVYNGDVGVAVRKGDYFDVWFPRAERNQKVESARLDRTATQWAMSIHKSQGSEFGHVVVTLPDANSRVLTRELLYTGVTRAKRELTVVATEGAIRSAVTRPVARSSGLAARLAG